MTTKTTSKDKVVTVTTKEFLIETTFGGAVQCVVRKAKSKRQLYDAVWAWAKKKYGILPGDKVYLKDCRVYGLGWTREVDIDSGVTLTERIKGGFRVNVMTSDEVIARMEREKKERGNRVIAGTSKGIVGNAVAEGLAIKRMKELQVLVEERDHVTGKVLDRVTTQDVFGGVKRGYQRPLAPSGGGKYDTTQNRSNTDSRKRQNGSDNNWKVPFGVSVDLLFEDVVPSISNDCDKIETVKPEIVLCESNQSRRKRRDDWQQYDDADYAKINRMIGEHTEVVRRDDETLPSLCIRNMKFTATVMGEQNGKQYYIVQISNEHPHGKTVWVTPIS